MESTAGLLAHQSPPQRATPQQDKQKIAIPPTPIKVMQAIGEDLQIDPALLTKDKLMANPHGGSPTVSHD